MANKLESEDQVLQLLNHIGDQEKHFNSLETQYRLLASTWLLACFGAMGYLLQSKNTFIIDQWLMVALIGLIGSVGIFLLWLMDIQVYHKLLHCVFIEGVILEQKYEWLPKIRTEMLNSQDTGEVATTTGLYYIYSLSILLLFSTTSFCIYSRNIVLLILISAAGIVMITLVNVYMRKAAISEKEMKLKQEMLKMKSYEI